MKKIIVSAVGKDRPGIVGALTEVFYRNRCNLEDTSMTQLEDHFAVLIILHAPDDVTMDMLERELQTVRNEMELQLDIHTIDTEREFSATKGKPWMVSVSGPDHTGIMFHVTQFLGEKNVNITHLSSKRLTRKDGEPLFLMALEVDVPETLAEDQFKQDLAQLAQKESLEIHAEPLEVYTL